MVSCVSGDQTDEVWGKGFGAYAVSVRGFFMMIEVGDGAASNAKRFFSSVL